MNDFLSYDGIRIPNGFDSSLPCEDDRERSAPYINMLPEESDTEDGSPLDFGQRW